MTGTDKWGCYQIKKLPHNKGNKYHSEQAAYHMGENYPSDQESIFRIYKIKHQKIKHQK